MLKKLILGLMTLGVLTAPINEYTVGKSLVNGNLQTKQQNVENKRFGGYAPIDIDDGFQGIAGSGIDGIGKMTPVANFRTFTVTVDHSSPTYESNDGTVVSSRRVGRLYREFTIRVTKPVGVHEFYSSTSAVHKCVCRVFSYLYKDTVFVSDESKEDAWYKAIKDDYENGLLTKQEVEDSYAEFLLLSSPNSNQREIEMVPSYVLHPYYAQRPSGEYAYVYSRVEWEDKYGNWSPLSKCITSLYINGECFGTKNLDENGLISFNIGSGSKYWGKTCKVQLRIYTQTNTFTLGSDYQELIENSPYYGVFDERYMIVSNEITTYISGSTDLYIPASRAYSQYEKTSSAMSICQALALCETFADSYVSGFANDPNLALYHLNVETSSSTCYFNFNGSSTLYYEADEDWMLPFRLYGLFVQGILRMLGSNTQFNYYHDYGNYVYEENIYMGKGMALQTVWRRSLADMFAILAYFSMEDDIGALGPVDPVWDYVDSVANYRPDGLGGEGSVFCTTVYLYNLYSGYTAKNGHVVPGMSESYSAFFNLVFNTALNTLTEFINYRFPTNDPIYSADNNSLLEDLCIAPSNVQLTNELGSNVRAVFSWNQGGCASHPNDEFDMWFYAGVGNHFKIQGIKQSYCTVNNGVVSYRLTAAQNVQFKNLLESHGGTCRVAVCGYRKDGNYNSGPYYSMFYTVVNPEIIADEPVYEREIHYCYAEKDENGNYLTPNHFTTYEYVKFRRSGSTMFFTRGDVDSVITISDLRGATLAQDDNGGYSTNAFITYNVTAGEIYRIEVKTVTNDRYFQGWGQFDIVQQTNSYDGNDQISHPTAYNDIRRIDYQEDYWERPDYDPEINYDYDRYLPIEEGSTAVLIYDSIYGGGFHLEFQYSANTTLIVMPLGQMTPYDYAYYSGSAAYVLGYLGEYINIIEGDACMILVSRENRDAPIGPGVTNQSFRLVFGLTYTNGEW